MRAPSTPLFLFVLTEPACPKAHGNQTPAVTLLIHSLIYTPLPVSIAKCRSGVSFSTYMTY